MAEQLLNLIVTTQESFEPNFGEWLLKQINCDNHIQLTLEEFGVYFLNFIREQTEDLLQTRLPKATINENNVDSNTHQTQVDPNGGRSSSKKSFAHSLPQPTSDVRTKNDDSLILHNTPKRNLTSSFNDSFQRYTPQKNSGLLNDSFHQSPHRGNTSTPKKSYNASGNCSGFNPNASDRNNSSNGICLGDFLVSCTRSKKKQHKDIFLNTSSSPEQRNKLDKPKKRVVPTQVNKQPVGSSSFTSPLSKENNFLRVFNNAEIVEKEKCQIMGARKNLKSNIIEISREMKEENQPPLLNKSLRETVQRMENLSIENTGELNSETKIDLNEVTHHVVLDRLAELYSFLIDFHITTNILSELSYLLSILNADNLPRNSQTMRNKSISANNIDTAAAFKSFINCIYFALQVLKLQKHLLALLDIKTLRVVLNNTRIRELAVDLKEYLENVTVEKQQLENKKSYLEASYRIGKTCSSNVAYQEDSDTKSNFPSDTEFVNFRAQRDLFYTIFKTWNDNHLNGMWHFKTTLSQKIQTLFTICDHPINMAHLAKLFVSQLLISSTYYEASPSDIGVEVDMEKFTKLTQRLVEPSNSSIDFLFPGQQAFFKDFLAISSFIAFTEQVKIALVVELLQLNNTSFEVINLSTNDETDNDHHEAEYAVRPEILSQMLVLAKFIGFVQSQPFAYNPSSSNYICKMEKAQIEMRNMLQPGFDTFDLLKSAIIERKMLITVPWLVQYLTMLDHVTLQLDPYRKVLHLLYELYICMTKTNVFQLRPTSLFILRTCLGWLFESANVSDSYYEYRRNRTVPLKYLMEMKEVTVLVPNALESELKYSPQQRPLIVVNIDKSNKNGLLMSLEQFQNKDDTTTNILPISTYHSDKFDSVSEGLLNVACPFLAEFRVAIMPTKNAKCLSRSGRYRHITPKISETTNVLAPAVQQPQDNQSKLIEAFLHSQNLSVRRIIEFVIERTTSAVIKDAQMEILLPSKDTANEKIKQMESMDIGEIKDQVFQIYTQAREEALKKWDLQLSNMMETRVQMALDALLPHETLESVKNTCKALILRKCGIKIYDWRAANMKNIDFYMNNMNIEKILKRKNPATSMNLEIIVSSPCIYGVLEDLEFWLHVSSRHPKLVKIDKIEKLLVTLQKIFVNVLPQQYYCVIGSSAVNLIQNLIEHHSSLISLKLISSFTNVWASERMREATRWQDISKSSNRNVSPSLFSSLITISFVRSLKTDESFDKLELLLLNLVEHNVITIDHLNELFVRIFKADWHQKVLNRISALLQTVSASKTKPAEDDGRSNLFMEVLADISRDIDLF